MTVGGAEGEAAVGPVSGIATASADGQRIGILLSNYVDDPEADFSTDTTVKFTGLPFPAGELRFRRYLIDASRSNAFDQWLSLGKPDKPTALEIRGLRRDAQLELFQEKVVTVAEDGTLSAAMRLPAHSVTLIELERIAGKPGK
jgi:xylan 1,4-beta-xylosidase